MLLMLPSIVELRYVAFSEIFYCTAHVQIHWLSIQIESQVTPALHLQY